MISLGERVFKLSGLPVRNVTGFIRFAALATYLSGCGGNVESTTGETGGTGGSGGGGSTVSTGGTGATTDTGPKKKLRLTGLGVSVVIPGQGVAYTEYKASACGVWVDNAPPTPIATVGTCQVFGPPEGSDPTEPPMLDVGEVTFSFGTEPSMTLMPDDDGCLSAVSDPNVMGGETVAFDVKGGTDVTPFKTSLIGPPPPVAAVPEQIQVGQPITLNLPNDGSGVPFRLTLTPALGPRIVCTVDGPGEFTIPAEVTSYIDTANAESFLVVVHDVSADLNDLPTIVQVQAGQLAAHYIIIQQ